MTTFTLGFKKTAAPPIMPTAQQGRDFRKGLHSGGPTFSEAMQNLKTGIMGMFGGTAATGAQGAARQAANLGR